MEEIVANFQLPFISWGCDIEAWFDQPEYLFERSSPRLNLSLDIGEMLKATKIKHSGLCRIGFCFAPVYIQNSWHFYCGMCQSDSPTDALRIKMCDRDFSLGCLPAPLALCLEYWAIPSFPPPGVYHNHCTRQNQICGSNIMPSWGDSAKQKDKKN